jgi:hypothetical protein
MTSTPMSIAARCRALAPALVASGLFIAAPARAQQPLPLYDTSNPFSASRGMEPSIRTRALGPVELVDLRVMPAIDLEAIAQEDLVRDEMNLPRRFAIRNEVFYSPATAGDWELVGADTWVWRLRLNAPDARSINLGFTRYHMPPGGTLFIYATDLSDQLRAFTAADNETHGQLWTPPVFSDDVVVEVTVPALVRDDLALELTAVNHGYRGFRAKDDADIASGSCNVDVACPESAGWEDEIDGVAVIAIDGSFACTGFMVNNTAQNRTPFFMTAFHCGLDSTLAPTLVAFWNYENSTCRTPGSAASGLPGDGPLDRFNTGSVFRSDSSTSDFTLVELDDFPDPAFGATYLGWDRTSANPTSAVAIHHPNTDEKRISFENNPTTTTSYSGTATPGDGTHIRIIDWDLGTTEGGSSGSPLFDQNQRVVGQLHGGGAACGNNESDWYGRFSVSWTGGGTNSTRLSNWLDPLGTGAMTLNTIAPYADCNSNGIDDPLDIAAMTALDCNENGVPDECDLGPFFTENMDDILLLPARDWFVQNNSSPIGLFSWGQGSQAFPAHMGSFDSYASVNFESGDMLATISNWLIGPEVELVNGRSMTFFTRTVTNNTFPDRLQVRLSMNGASTDVGATATSVGDFTMLLVDINEFYVVEPTAGFYPDTWTMFSATVSGVPLLAEGGVVTGRFAFRYFVELGGPLGANSNLIGVDTVEYQSLSNDQDDDGVPDECAALCAADFIPDPGGDGTVNVSDLLSLLASWGPCVGCPADIAPEGAPDGMVNVSDLLFLLASWGACP